MSSVDSVLIPGAGFQQAGRQVVVTSSVDARCPLTESV